MWIRFENAISKKGLFTGGLYDYDSPKQDLSSEAKRRMQKHARVLYDELDEPPGDACGPDIEFWFRADAKRFLVRAYWIANLLRKQGVPMIVRVSQDPPGKLVWEDYFQAAFSIPGKKYVDIDEQEG